MNIKKRTALSFFLFLFFGMSHAQGVLEVKTLFFSEGVPGFQVFSDTIKITKVSNDTTWFNTSESNPTGSGFYFMTGQRVYKRDDFTDFLLYDYNLIAGDTILRRNYVQTTTYRVDSVYYKKMGNRQLKAWHLTSMNGGSAMEWVEGLGELRLGWDIFIYVFLEMNWVVKGICLNDTLIYWDSATNFIQDPNPSPSCMFESIRESLGVQKVVGNSINLYPNPASDVLRINSKTNGKLSILDVMGKTYLNDIPIQEGAQTIDTSTLPSGAYVVAIRYGNDMVYKKILILNNH